MPFQDWSTSTIVDDQSSGLMATDKSLTGQLSENTTHSSTNFSGPFDYSCWILDDPPPLMLSHKIYLYTSLLFMVLGLVGNTLSVMVFSSSEMRVLSSNVYLLVLAISDSIYLMSVFFSKNMTYIRCFYFPNSFIDIYNQSAFFCKFLQYTQDLFSGYSTCVIMAFTLERYVAVYHPMRFKELCTVWRARILCIGICVVIAIFTIPYHILYIHRYSEYNMCTVRVSYEKTFTILFAVESIIFRIVPVFVISVLNVLIIVRVSQVKKLARRRHSNDHRKSRNSKQTKHDKSLQLTIILILVSTSYVITYIPVLVHFVIWKLQRSNLINVSQDIMLITRNYTRMVYIIGFAINFFLYTLSGRVFREQLEVLLCNSKVPDEPKVPQNFMCSGKAIDGPKVTQNGVYKSIMVTVDTEV